MTPTKLGAKEFEELLLDAAKREEKAGRLTMVRYGTQVTVGQDEKLTKKSSLPDFDGATFTGGQFIIEAKVCSQASFSLDLKTIKLRQVRHMLKRASFSVPCFVVIHWNERRGKTFHDPSETVALSVSSRFPFWQAFVDEAAAAKKEGRSFISPGSISREHASRIGRRIEWTCPKGSRKHLPDLASLLGLEPAQPSLL